MPNIRFSRKPPKNCKHCKSENVGKALGVPYFFCFSCKRLLGEIKQKKGTDRSKAKAVVTTWTFADV